MSTKQETIALILATIPQNVPVVLTDGTTITWDFSLGNLAQVTIAGNRTLVINNLPNNTPGMITVIQDTTGSRTLTVSGIKEGGGSWALSTAANTVDKIGFLKESTGIISWWAPAKNFS